MSEDHKYYHDEWQECTDPYASMNVAENGDYLCVQWSEHPMHVYKRVQPGERVHPYTDQFEYNGQSYRLELIVDEKEFATSSS